MKKAAAILMSALLLLVITGCGGNENAKPETAAPSADLTETEDLTIIAGFTYDNRTYIVVENTGDKTILNYTVTFINYDSNGFVTTTRNDGFENGKAEAVNMMPGKKSIVNWYGATGTCVDAVITSIDYSDGSKWEFKSVEQWIKNSKATFTVDGYNAKISALSEQAKMAETNEHLSLDDFWMERGNQFSDKDDLHFSLTNTSSQGITHANVFVLEFDASGFPTAVSPYDTYCLNGHTTGGTINLGVGASDSFVDDLFIQGATTQVKIVVANLTFRDGTEWENPYLYEWIIANNKSYQ